MTDSDQNHRLQLLLHSPFDAVFLLDEDGRFLYVNKAFETLCGWRSADILGRGLMVIIPADGHRFMLDRWNESMQGVGGQYETETVTATGERRTLLLSQWRVPAAHTHHVLSTAKDITAARAAGKEREAQRLRLEDKVQQRTVALVDINARLSRSEAALARAQATARIGSWEWDLVSERPEWSLEMFKLHGLPAAPVAPTVTEIVAMIHPADREQVVHLVQRASRHGLGFKSEHRIVQRDGAVIDVLALGEVTQGPPDHARSLSGTFQDITTQRRLERDLVEASRHEQQRIGRDIHDSLGQELTGLALMAKALEKQIRKTAPRLSERAATISALAGQAANRARNIAHGLAPVDMAAAGLCTELQRMSERVCQLYGVKCEVAISGDAGVHDHAVATHLYHIVQEAVTNALKHASPSVILIEMQGGGEGRLSVTDDGPGLPATVREGAIDGIGLRIMRHRADIIGARLSMDPVAGGGTRVSCVFPNRPLAHGGGGGGPGEAILQGG